MHSRCLLGRKGKYKSSTLFFSIRGENAGVLSLRQGQEDAWDIHTDFYLEEGAQPTGGGLSTEKRPIKELTGNVRR